MDQFNLKPKVARMAEEFISKCAEQGIEIAITEGFRSIARQNALYAQGRTKPGRIVTNAKGGQSNHNYGVAIDVVFVKDGKNTYAGDWDRIGQIGKSIGFAWGGDWISFRDRPHFEYLAGYRTSDFQQKRVDESRFA